MTNAPPPAPPAGHAPNTATPAAGDGDSLAIGIRIGPLAAASGAAAGERLHDWLRALGLASWLRVDAWDDPHGPMLRLRPTPDAWAWMPEHDTLGLRDTLDRTLGPAGPDAGLDRETVVALAASPVAQDFPSVDELFSAVRLRRRVAVAAARTAMAFHTSRVARPAAYWDHDEDRGFTLRPGCSLIEALRVTTQPDVSGDLYAFSCYRATEYVLLLALAEELAEVNPTLLAALEERWRQEAIASGRFHDVFLREFGTNEQPLPARWYVPGDRIWFRNPDEASSDASGYEGSWTLYLGGGLFANLWRRDAPFTLEGKCLEIFHWRDATWRDAEGELRIDETVVAAQVARTAADPAQRAAVVERMLRLRDLRGVYAEGGCIDRTRESLRWVRPATSDIVLPPAG
jgi:hypothetical protein